jgi:protein-S-isoprenylcysteine O-methyltransferase Ste14
MQTLPDFKIGVFNGWLPLILYLVGFSLALVSFSTQARAKLFQDPKYEMPASVKFVRFIGQATMFAYIGMMVFTPLAPSDPILLTGVLVYAVGYGSVMLALYYFKHAPANQAVVAGPYRFSRNPQWVGLVLVLAGAAIMSGIWLYLVIILVVAVIYHLQILAEEKACLEQYGDGFRTYIVEVPRYFWFL